MGGHCIPVDPYYLIEKAKELDFDHKFLRVAREINNSMPLFTVELLQDALNKIQKSFKGTNIGILGVSYKANVGDLRESPALKIIDFLKNREAVLHIFDPHVAEKSTAANLEEVLKNSDAIVIATNHREFVEIPPEKFSEYGVKVVIDGMNCLDKEKILKQGIIYRGIGR